MWDPRACIWRSGPRDGAGSVGEVNTGPDRGQSGGGSGGVAGAVRVVCLVVGLGLVVGCRLCGRGFGRGDPEALADGELGGVFVGEVVEFLECLPGEAEGEADFEEGVAGLDGVGAEDLSVCGVAEGVFAGVVLGDVEDGAFLVGDGDADAVADAEECGVDDGVEALDAGGSGAVGAGDAFEGVVGLDDVVLFDDFGFGDGGFLGAEVVGLGERVGEFFRGGFGRVRLRGRGLRLRARFGRVRWNRSRRRLRLRAGGGGLAGRGRGGWRVAFRHFRTEGGFGWGFGGRRRCRRWRRGRGGRCRS